jgi:hypothetical protein
VALSGRNSIGIGNISLCQAFLEKKATAMTQENVPVSEETFDLLRFLSGYGFWLILAIALIAVVAYKKFRK